MEWTPGRLLNWGQKIGTGTRAVVQWQLENRPHPEQGYRACLGLMRLGRVHGAAFPSQHVAGAVAALWGAWRHRRWLFWTFLPFVVCMCVSTVYVRNHYVTDVFGGMVTGTLGYVIGNWIMKMRGAVANEAR